MVNSRLDLFTAPILMGPLLPKLRGYSAEFLNNISLAHLRILSSPTCVGLRYGPHQFSFRSFSRRREISYFSTFSSIRITPSAYRTDLPIRHLLCLHRFLHSRLTLSFCVPTFLLYDSTGISTCYPSTTHFCLALGPDLPRADQLYPGNLRYSA